MDFLDATVTGRRHDAVGRRFGKGDDRGEIDGIAPHAGQKIHGQTNLVLGPLNGDSAADGHHGLHSVGGVNSGEGGHFIGRRPFETIAQSAQFALANNPDLMAVRVGELGCSQPKAGQTGLWQIPETNHCGVESDDLARAAKRISEAPQPPRNNGSPTREHRRLRSRPSIWQWQDLDRWG